MKFLLEYLENYIRIPNDCLKMVKLIGLLLIVSSLLALAVGTFIDIKYSTTTQITGNVITDIITPPHIEINFADYIAGFVFSYSIVSFIMGVVYLLKM